MVVACPSCQTKFAVDEELLVGVANPRFHCSRCDHFFEGSASLLPGESAGDFLPRRSTQASLESSASDALNNFSPGGDRLSSERAGRQSAGAVQSSLSKQQLSLPLDYPGNSTGDSSVAPLSPQLFLDDLEREIERPDDIASTKGVVIPWPTTGRSTAIETDLTGMSDRGQAFQPIAKRLTQSEWTRGALSSENEFASDPPFARNEDEPLSWDDTLPWEEQAPGAIQHLHGQHDSSDQFASSASHSSPGTTGDTSVGPGRIRIQNEDSFSNGFPAFNVPRGQHPALLLILPFLFLGILSAEVFLQPRAFHLKAIPTILSGVLAQSHGGTQVNWKVAPSSVSVRNASGRVIPLEDGTKVFEVRGNVFNESDHPLRDIMIQSKMFTADGLELKSILAPAANQLQDTRLEALNGKLLESLGEKPARKQESLAPGRAYPFRIIFSELPSAASDFGVRVFSVEREDVV